MIKINIKIGIDQTVQIGECHVEVELSMDKILEEGHNMIKIRGVSRTGNFQGVQNYRGWNFGGLGVPWNDILGRGRSRYRKRQH